MQPRRPPRRVYLTYLDGGPDDQKESTWTGCNFDTTLRDEQSPGFSMNVEEAEDGSPAERLQVDIIEAGFPIV